jgi:hypothetical protein
MDKVARKIVGQLRASSVRAMAWLATVVGCLVWFVSMAAATQPAYPIAIEHEASTSDASRHDALRSIPLGRLSDADREKVNFVLSNVSLFRRLPVKTIDCDPALYLFLMHHPDVVVNIWEVFKISRLQLREGDENQFRLLESTGAAMAGKFVYQSRGTHVLYGEGVYQGPLFPRPIKGRGVLVLKTAYVQQPSGRYHITSRLDCFLNIDSLGAELATKTVSPLLGKTVDNNFVQTLAFVGSLSRTAEVNSLGVERLASQLTHVQPDVREQFADLAADVSDRQAGAAAAAAERREQMEVASKTTLRR